MLTLALFFLPLMVFNQIPISSGGINLFYVFILLSFLLSGKYSLIISKRHFYLLLSLFVLISITVCKLVFYGHTDFGLLFKLCFVLFFNVLIFIQFREIVKSIKWFCYGFYFSCAFATIQYIGLFFDLWLTLPVYLWNPSAWHIVIIRDEIPRASGFSYEPAYLAMFVAFYYVLNKFGYVKLDRFSLKTTLFSILTGSRNLYVGFIFILMIKLSSMISKKLIMIICVLALLSPLYLLSVDLDSVDASILARAVGLILFYMQSSVDFGVLFFGLPDYSGFFSSYESDSSLINSVILSEKIYLEPKSLLAFFLLNFGTVGTILFLALLYKAVEGNKNKICMLVFLWLVFFNVTVIFWPLFWLAIACVCYDMKRECYE